MAENPYSSLPDHRFWRKAVTSLPPFALDPIIRHAFQDLAAGQGGDRRQLLRAGDRPCACRPADTTIISPSSRRQGMSADEALRRNYSMYSCRYGNLYTTAQLLPADRPRLWRFKPQLDHWNRPEDGRFVDPFRPRIEPDGYRNARRHARRSRTASRRRAPHARDDGRLRLHLRPHRDLAPQAGWRDPAARAGRRRRRLGPERLRVLQYDRRAKSCATSWPPSTAFARSIRRCASCCSVSPVGIIATYEDRHVIESNCGRQGDSARRRRRGRAGAAEHRLFPVLRSRDGLAQRAALLSGGHATHQSLRRRPHDEDVLRPFHRSRARSRRRSSSLKIDVAAEAESNSRVVCDEEAIEDRALKAAKRTPASSSGQDRDLPVTPALCPNRQKDVLE